MQTASMPLDGNPIPTNTSPNMLKLFLVIIAVIETLNPLMQLSMLSVTLFGETTSGASGWTGAMLAAVGSFVAVAALVFAVKGRLRHAIVAVAAIGLMDWLNDLPSNTALDYSASFNSLSVLFHIFVLPVFCIAGIVFAIRNVRLGWAAVMAAMPLIVDILLVVMFGIRIAMYG
jgi:hypothetical protein